jgi:hypothetical protein
MAPQAELRGKTRWGARWPAAELRQLGKVPDPELARRKGRTIKEVVAEREARHIGLVTAPRRWTAREIQRLSKCGVLTIDTFRIPSGGSWLPAASLCANSLAPSRPPAPTASATPTPPSTPPSAPPTA